MFLKTVCRAAYFILGRAGNIIRRIGSSGLSKLIGETA